MVFDPMGTCMSWHQAAFRWDEGQGQPDQSKSRPRSWAGEDNAEKELLCGDIIKWPLGDRPARKALLLPLCPLE